MLENKFPFHNTKHTFISAVRMLLVGMCLSFSLLYSSQLFSQQAKGAIYAGLGLGLSNQRILPYHQKSLQIENSPIRDITIEMGFQLSIHRSFAVRTGVAYKKKGTKIDAGYQLNSIWTTYRYIARNQAVSPSLTALYMPGKHEKKSIYFMTGVSLDWIFGDKPDVTNYLLMETPANFNNDRYKRLIMNAVFGVGVPIGHGLFIQVVYSPALSDSFNVDQMRIRENFWSIAFTTKTGLKNEKL